MAKPRSKAMKAKASPPTGRTGDRIRAAARAVADDRFDEARRLLKPVIGKPLGVEDQAALAALLRELGHPAAEAELAKADIAIKDLPDTGDGQHTAARALTLLGREAEARGTLARALELDPRSTEAGMLALRLHIAAGDVAAATRAIAPVIAALPDPRRFTLNVVKALGVAGHTGPALVLLDGLNAPQDDAEVAYIRAGLEGREADGQGAMATAIFDGFAETYDANLARIDNNGPAMVGALLQRIDPGKVRVLDAGCGTGLCAPLLRPHARHLTGCDISVPMLEKAKAKRGYDALTRSDLGAPVTLPPGPFDLIVAADVMTYFGDLTPVLRGLAGVLAPGGWIVFTVEEATEGPPHALTPTGRSRHRADGLAAMLTAAGLTPPRHELRDRLRTEFGQPVPGLAVAAQKLALFG